MELLTPQNFKDYELLDSGNFEKLERFGQYITIRPEPQAVWNRQKKEADWLKEAHVKFVAKNSSSGTWKKLKEIPDRWHISYALPDAKQIRLRLALTSFKHVGVFPEQAVNWDFIYHSVKKLDVVQPKVLNLFAYTGAATLAAKVAGADIIHLDSIKQVITWAKENMTLSGLDNIRWLVEDAMTFVKREVKRGKKYQGIILDPPAYGHGPNGENWKLEDEINEMLANVKLLLEENHFLVLNTYSLGFSSIILDNLLDEHFSKNIKRQTGEIFLQSTAGARLPLGVFARHCTV
ncbi:MAG TPA: class I SAM-dependent methyltransferase [Bacteroidia bacterium]|nr:class I SAM-dependent methyltransferase [Bacteroidia bacterium]HNB12086.1 class I SAM-dependent methyltransferase [Bacteroidia bacterium]HND71193.1 class I SAM-dependent methyltransferase [Bacteroidia bacterium]HNF31101.1 class I SAM-dependent methyltransferase [Bacteroidia bacterium]HNF39665.1 class I SAM-dependent methyltransferase [Bacteroidia bacterium]